MKHLNKDTTRPGKAARVNERFDLNGVTSFGGANILFDYAEQIGLGLKLHEVCTKFEKAANATYPLFSSLLVLVFGRTLGLLRIAEFTRLENDPLLATKFGFAKLPDAKLLYKDLDRLTTEATKGLAEVARWLAARLIKKEKAVILDVDSTVETVYGSLEKAAVGYNPTKRGRASFHPQLGFDGITRTLLGAQLRSGNTTSRTNVLDFLKDLLGTLPLGTKVKAIRADRGYQGEAVFSFLEERNLPYVIKAKMTAPLLDWADTLTYHPIVTANDEEILEAASGLYQASSWEKARRVVIVRKRLISDRGQLLFTDLTSDYEAIVTTLDWAEEDISAFYNHRCTAETFIKELKDGFGIDQFSSMSFEANQADLWLKAIAYNLILAFQSELLPDADRIFQINTLRRWFLWIPGRLVRHARSWSLRLPHLPKLAERFALFRSRLALV